MSPASSQPSRWTWPLLAMAVLVWGLNWPVMKLGVAEMTPLWFATIRVALGALTLFAVLAFQDRLSWPGKADLPVVASIGILQIALCVALLNSALRYVEAGRSAALAYTTPVWTFPLAYVLLGERPTPRKLAGLAVAVAGIVWMFNPVDFPWAWDGYTLGNGMLILSAIAWAVAIVHGRAHRWQRPHFELLPWQLAIGAVLLAVTAYAVDGMPTVPPTPNVFAILFYNGPIATAFAFWAYIAAVRALPANSVAMASLGIPVTGYLSSSAFLGEPLAPATNIGLALLIGGIALSVVGGRRH